MARIYVVGVIGVLAACTHENGSVSTMPASVLEASTLELTLVTGASVDVHPTQLPNGQIALADERGYSISADLVETVTETNHVLGFVQGLGLGALAGFAGGAVLGLADGDDPPCDECWFNMTAGEKAVFGGILLGGFGGIVGAFIGAVRGQHETWTVARTAHEPPIKVMPSGPPGSVMGVTIGW